ncbi:F-box protein At2g32560 [Ricinus communis]|uniref:F-box protein At2g32560 n=1 Tax=Ricinus communis TaxID=3988 RepID=UPI00201A267A|nr:F-box protein At2g32560 [Ricinus communis]
MLLYFFITCFSFFFFKSLPLEPLPSWASEVRLLSLWFWKELFLFPYFGSFRNTLFKACISTRIPSKMSMKKMALICNGKLEQQQHQQAEDDEISEVSVLDLPELALECILEKLPPKGLCSMAGVCTSLRQRCLSDHLWERHMKQKWGKIIGPAAYREWQFHIASRNDFGTCKQGKQKGLMRLLSIVWPPSWIRPKDDCNIFIKQRSSLPVDSIMSWYLALETGRFWFPAQVYNRENGHVGFMLSCYDADLSYDPRKDTFQARYPPHGRRATAIENGVPWERLRAPPADTSPHDLHISDCLNELRPGDHIEIQWRRNKEFPYGWWYGVVGHLESCDGNENYCRCHNSDTVVLEFHQYTRGSRWRYTMINRKEHREEGNEADGFYGGIRKLNSKEEISRWKQLWPTEVLE